MFRGSFFMLTMLSVVQAGTTSNFWYDLDPAPTRNRTHKSSWSVLGPPYRHLSWSAGATEGLFATREFHRRPHPGPPRSAKGGSVCCMCTCVQCLVLKGPSTIVVKWVKLFKTEKTIEIQQVRLTEVCGKVLSEKNAYKSVKTALLLSNVIDAGHQNSSLFTNKGHFSTPLWVINGVFAKFHE